MSRGSTFGKDPEGLDRLFAVGLQNSDALQDALATASLGQFMEQPGGWIGNYLLLSVLGEGGMGVVYLARQEGLLRRQVALKVIKPGMDSARVVARFEAERQALALMEHPHVARVFDAGLTPSGRPYFVMEHVRGVPITCHCDEQRLTIRERLALFLRVCEAIQHAHQKGIIHRDLKPSNILVAMQDGNAIPKVIDFGIARAIAEPLTERTLYTEQGQLVGTPEYMSPEQADLENQDIDTRTDVYSLGVLLYELLTGELPFDREILRQGGIDHIRKVIHKQDAATPSMKLSKASVTDSTESARKRQTDTRTLQHQLRGELDWITLKALDKDRERRYAAVDALAGDIQNYLNNQPVSAAPPAALYRAKKFVLRHPQAVAGTCAVFLVLVALFWVIRTQVLRAREHARFKAFEHGQLLRQAQDAYGNRHWDDALAKVDALLTSPHVGRQARLLHAQLVLEDEGAGAAVAELERLLGTPDEVAGQAHFLLANIYYDGDPCAPGGTQEHSQRWQQHREQAESLIADTASYYFLRAQAAYSIKENLEMLAEALWRDRQHYDSLRERAQIYHSQRDYDKMVRDAARMIGIRPDNPQGYALSALALQGMGRLEEALEDHDEAIQLAPDDPRLYNARRETYMRLGQYESALHDAQTCVELQPRDLPYRHQVFAAYTALGRYDEALREYVEFLSYPVLQEHRLGGVPLYLRGLFYLFSLKLVAESAAVGRLWHGPGNPPLAAPYGLMYDSEPFYRNLQAQGRQLVARGFHPSWSPDGTKLAYSHGLLMASGVAVLDSRTGQTELLTNSGRCPEWSPDGRYIAFERRRRIWPIDRLVGLDIRTWRPDGWLVTHAEEIWIADARTHEIRHVAVGVCPRWGHRTGHLYYNSPEGEAMYAVAPDQPDVRPIEVISGCTPSAVISPDEKYIADHVFHELRIIDVASREIVDTWIAPPVPLGGLRISWSPDSRELAIGSPNGSWMGLWIYDVETRQALKVLNGWWMTSRWAPDKSKMALTLGVLLEIWQLDLEPGLPTVASFEKAWTVEEHCRYLMGRLNDWVAADPAFAQTYYQRARCALWMDHPQAAEYLRQFEQVLPPYNAADCDHEARWMLDATPELRDRLLPLALLLAHKAVEKEPRNPDFLMTLGKALLRVGDWEDTEVILRRAYDLTSTGSEPSHATTGEAVQLLIQLYEAWDKPDETARWRAKLPQKEAIEQ